MTKKRNITIVIVAIVLILLLSACGKNEHEHTYIYESQATKHRQVCKECDDEQSWESHKYSEWKETIPATCQMPGEQERTCIQCSYTEKKDISPLSHSYKLKQTIFPTCIMPGEQLFQCEICNNIKKEVINSKNHVTDDEWEVKQEATCKEKGLAEKKCQICNEVIETKELDCLPHSWEYHYSSEKHWEICKVCGKESELNTHQFTNKKCDICKYDCSKISEGLEFKQNSDGSYSVGLGETSDKTIFIPNEYKGKLITGIMEKGFSKSLIERIVLPVGLKKIGNSAFEGCCNLEEIYLPDSLNEIGNFVFNNCNKLVNIRFLNKEIKLGQSVFENCPNLNFNEYGNGLYLGNENNKFSLLLKVKNKTAVDVHPNAKMIYKNAFRECLKLERLEIEKNISGLEENSLQNCVQLEEAKVPTNIVPYLPKKTIKKLEIIEEESFQFEFLKDFTNLESIILPFVGASINGVENSHFGYIFGAITAEENAKFIPTNLKEVKITGGEIIGDKAFLECRSIKNIILPISVTSIGSSAFKNCYVVKATIPTIVLPFIEKSTIQEIDIIGGETIPINIFSNYGQLKSVIIGDGVKSIGDNAFSGCSNLTSIVIPNSVTSIGDNAFAGCNIIKASIPTTAIPSIPKDKLEEVIITGGESIGERAFSGCSSLTSIVIPNSVISIGLSTFYNCSSLTSITIPNSVTSIGERVFSGCSSLTSITIPESVTSIGEDAFRYCSKLTSITIPNSVISIGLSTFYNCSSLTSITIPESVTSIGERAFFGCSSLTSVTIGNSVTSIGSSAFDRCIIVKATLPTTAIPSIPKDKLEEVIITGGESIGSSAFKYCSHLTSIVIPNSVTSIGYNAFYGCYNLVEIYNLSNLNITAGSSDNGYVGEHAKVIHTSLEEESRLIEKDNYIFIKDNNNQYYLVSYKGTETELILPNDIEGNNYEINQYAFYKSSSLTSIVIPNSVTSIRKYAFYYCSSLKDVFYTGTSTEWKNISIEDSGNSYLTSATIYYYSETKPSGSGNYWHYENNKIVIW